MQKHWEAQLNIHICLLNFVFSMSFQASFGINLDTLYAHLSYPSSQSTLSSSLSARLYQSR